MEDQCAVSLNWRVFKNSFVMENAYIDKFANMQSFTCEITLYSKGNYYDLKGEFHVKSLNKNHINAVPKKESFELIKPDLLRFTENADLTDTRPENISIEAHSNQVH